MTESYLEDLGDGVHAVDSGYIRKQFDAVHLIISDDRAAIVDTATARSAPRVLAALAQLGIPRENVDYVILTHVHLDHAGGAGTLMAALPNARLTVHPLGARHMIDPAKLWAGTCLVYGEQRAVQMYGGPTPVPAQRVIETPEGASVNLAGRVLEFYDTPGHARHHVTIRDTLTGNLFTGDTFGIAYREFDVDGRAFLIPSSTPTQFDPEQLLRSVERILALAPPAVYLTHYSRRDKVAALGVDLKRRIAGYVEIAQAEAGAGAERQARIEARMARYLIAEARAHGASYQDAEIAALLEADISLNSAGLINWLDRIG